MRLVPHEPGSRLLTGGLLVAKFFDPGPQGLHDFAAGSFPAKDREPDVSRKQRREVCFSRASPC